VAVFLHSSVHRPLWRRLFSLPQTGPGWLSVVLAALFVVLFSLDVAVFLPSPGVEPWLQTFFGIMLLVYGLASGVEALYALIRCHERSILSWLAIVPGLLVIFWVIGKFVVVEVLLGWLG
jgi:hypothetical protein